MSAASATTCMFRSRPSMKWRSLAPRSRCASTRTCVKMRWCCTASRPSSSCSIFERLISVSGIGPKLALAVLSGIEPNELVSAIRTANVARLTGIPGIGKKTAERIGLELKDKMAAFLPADVAASPAAASSETLRTDVLSALMNLGYHRPLAERAVDAALKHGTGTCVRRRPQTRAARVGEVTRLLRGVPSHRIPPRKPRPARGDGAPPGSGAERGEGPPRLTCQTRRG